MSVSLMRTSAFSLPAKNIKTKRRNFGPSTSFNSTGLLSCLRLVAQSAKIMTSRKSVFMNFL
jgi:hypothetical protein